MKTKIKARRMSRWDLVDKAAARLRIIPGSRDEDYFRAGYSRGWLAHSDRVRRDRPSKKGRETRTGK